MPSEVPETPVRNTTVLVLSSCTCSTKLVVPNTADNRWSNDPNPEYQYFVLVLKSSFHNVTNGDESICTSINGGMARMEGEK